MSEWIKSSTSIQNEYENRTCGVMMVRRTLRARGRGTTATAVAAATVTATLLLRLPSINMDTRRSSTSAPSFMSWMTALRSSPTTAALSRTSVSTMRSSASARLAAD